MSPTDIQREAITLAKLWLAYGERGKVQALSILTHAAESMLGAQFCSWCDATVIEPVHDPITKSWLGSAAPVFCSQTCLAAFEDQQINAAGGAS